MTRLVVLSALGLVAAAASPALAQAPGDCDCAAPAPVAVVVVEAPRKIGVGLRMSAFGMHPEAAPEQHTDFAGGGLAVSYRIRPRWGLVLTADHFTESQPEGMTETTPRELQAISLSAMFHLRPHSRRWNPYVIAGLDAVSEISDRAPVQLAGGHLGAGLERRFRRLGVSAELRMIGLSESEAEPAPAQSTTAPMEPAAGHAGAQLTLGASYYF